MGMGTREPGALAALVAAVPHPNLFESLQPVAEELPLAVGVDLANIRLVDGEDALHLVAASGCAPTEIRKRAFTPLARRTIENLLANGGQDEIADSLGVRWMEVVWIRSREDVFGTILVGCRTKRRPTGAGIRLLHSAAEELAGRLEAVEHTAAELSACSMKLARRSAAKSSASEGRAARLRPREREILEVYADGLTTDEIASMLVISPHTIRTHVKLALRRLGVHSREEAATIVRSEQMAHLL